MLKWIWKPVYAVCVVLLFLISCIKHNKIINVFDFHIENLFFYLGQEYGAWNNREFTINIFFEQNKDYITDLNQAITPSLPNSNIELQHKSQVSNSSDVQHVQSLQQVMELCCSLTNFWFNIWLKIIIFLSLWTESKKSMVSFIFL